MNPIWTQIVIQGVLNRKKKDYGKKQYSDYQIAKGFRELKIIALRYLKDVILISAGVGAAAFGLESFLLPNSFIDGGVTGISLLVTEITSWPLPILLVLINIPFILLGAKVISSEFAIKTAIAISALAVCIYFFHFPQITHDKLLVSAFGGFFLGAGIGLSIRGGAVLDGTEILAIYLSRKLHTTIGDFIIIFNIVIFGFAAYFLSIEQALYSMITYLAASKTLDFVVEGIEEYVGVTIISTHSAEINEVITHDLGRGVTIYNGKGGYGKRGTVYELEIIYTVVTRFEISKLNYEILKIDPNAFIVSSPVKDIKGGMVKKRRLKV
ncbi:MAG: hypothetical protein K0S32_506 [Bacteroidetes bacterium]|jgi:uncharacterized membrane-anchored protein YitT (DUF2179 family)|nr:hypothetical protein [Bacteroidota bacterium]